eukprot:COSAG02_NODE_40326_length_406_cov_21.413681_1_plen_110_part_10
MIIGESIDVAMSLDALIGVIHTEPFLTSEVNVIYRDQGTVDVANELDASSGFENESDDESDDELLDILNRTRPVPPTFSQEETTLATSRGKVTTCTREMDASRRQRNHKQ